MHQASPRSLVESFLMKNGLPIYATGSTYQGDVTVTKVRQNRDERLVQSMIIPDETLIASPKRILYTSTHFGYR